MSTAQLLEHLKQLSDAERLEVIEAASRLVRDDIDADRPSTAAERGRQMRVAAERLKDLYEPGGEFAEWTALDAEEFLDDSTAG